MSFRFLLFLSGVSSEPRSQGALPVIHRQPKTSATSTTARNDNHDALSGSGIYMRTVESHPHR